MGLHALAGVFHKDNEKFSKMITGSHMCLHIFPFPELVKVMLSNLEGYSRRACPAIVICSCFSGHFKNWNS